MQTQQNVIELASTDAIPVALREQICNCTGRRLGTWSVNELARLQTIHGKRAELALFASYGNYTSPEWRIKDNNALDALMRYDPAGYCVHALALICDLDREYSSIRQRAELYNKLSIVPSEAVDKTNRMLRRLLTLANPKFLRQQVGAQWPTVANVALLQDEVARWLKVLVDLCKKINVKIEDIPHTKALGALHTAYVLQQYGRAHKTAQDTLFDDLQLDLDDILDTELRVRKVREKLNLQKIRIETPVPGKINLGNAVAAALGKK